MELSIFCGPLPPSLCLASVGASLLVLLLLQDGALLGLAALLLRWRGKSLARMGLRKPARAQVQLGVELGIVLFAVCCVLTLGIELALRRLLSHDAYAWLQRWESASAEAEFGRLHSPWLMLSFALIGVVVVPLCEESFFRGWLYTTLKDRFGMGFALVGSALIFGLAHASPLKIGIIFIMGLILAASYERTRSLWVPILMHSVNNALGFVLLWR